jgi:hypothetical protein
MWKIGEAGKHHEVEEAHCPSSNSSAGRRRHLDGYRYRGDVRRRAQVVLHGVLKSVEEKAQGSIQIEWTSAEARGAAVNRISEYLGSTHPSNDVAKVGRLKRINRRAAQFYPFEHFKTLRYFQ